MSTPQSALSRRKRGVVLDHASGTDPAPIELDENILLYNISTLLTVTAQQIYPDHKVNIVSIHYTWIIYQLKQISILLRFGIIYSTVQYSGFNHESLKFGWRDTKSKSK